MKALKEIGITKALKYLVCSPSMILFKLIPYSPLRVLFLKIVGVKIGKRTIIHDVRFFNIYRKGFSALNIGNECFIGDECMFDLADKINIGNKVTLGERVIILTHTNMGYKDHPLQEYFPSYNKPVILENGCFIGTNSTILPGIKIGKCSVIGAGSVVNKDVSDYTIVGGVPAKEIRKLK